MGSVMPASYHRAYRVAHRAEINARDRERKRLRRSKMTAEERRKDRGVSPPTPPIEPIPALHTGHPLFERAKIIAAHRVGMRVFDDGWSDDLVSEVVLALLEGKSPEWAARRFKMREFAWRRNIQQILDGYEPHAGKLIPDW